MSAEQTYHMRAGETGAELKGQEIKNLYRVWAIFYTEGERRTFCVVLQTITGLRSTMLIMDDLSPARATSF